MKILKLNVAKFVINFFFLKAENYLAFLLEQVEDLEYSSYFLYHLFILREHLGSLVFQLDPAGWHLASGFGTVSKELLPSFLSLRRAHHDGLLEAVLPWG